MNKAVDIAKISVKGGFHVMWGLVAYTIISALTTIIAAWLLGEENFGLYTIALTAPAMIALFRDWGITAAMIRYIAQSNADGKLVNIRHIFRAGLFFEIVLGLSLSLISLLFSNFIAVTAFNRPLIAPLLQIASFTIIANALVSTATAFFTGIEKMHLNSIMVVVQAVLKAALIITLVAVGLGSYGAIFSVTVATFVSGLVGLALIFSSSGLLMGSDKSKPEILKNIRVMFRYGLPISLAGIISGFLSQYLNFLFYIYVSDNVIIGNYGMASNFLFLIAFFATPISTMLFPAFSKLDYEKDRGTLKNVFQASVKYASLLVVPMTAMVMLLAQPAVSTLFGNRYAETPLFLATLAVSYLFVALGNLSIGNLINSQGNTTFNLILTTVTVAIGFTMGIALISQWGVIGLIVTSVIAGIPSLGISMFFVKKKYALTIDWKASGKVMVSAAIAVIPTYAFLLQTVSFASVARLISGAIIYVVVYLVVSVFIKAFNKKDLANLRELFSTLGRLRKVLDKFLNIVEKLMIFSE